MNEVNLIGYMIGALDDNAHHEVDDYVAANPECHAQLERLRQALNPLTYDIDAFEPPDDLVLRTIARVAEHVVATEERVVETGASPVAEFLQSITRRDTFLEPPPYYPWRAGEAEPPRRPRRNLIVGIGLTAAVVMIAAAGVMTLRQTQEVQGCKNNLRGLHEDIDQYVSLQADERYPQVAHNEDVRATLAKMQKNCSLPRESSLVCPGGTQSPNGLPRIDYAYNLGYRDDQGKLLGLSRVDGDKEQFPIFADAPDRVDGKIRPVNHRKGHNVLFAGGNVRFTPSSEVGPLVDGKPDDIFFNTDHEPHAGKHRKDIALGGPNDQP